MVDDALDVVRWLWSERTWAPSTTWRSLAPVGAALEDRMAALGELARASRTAAQ